MIRETLAAAAAVLAMSSGDAKAPAPSSTHAATAQVIRTAAADAPGAGTAARAADANHGAIIAAQGTATGAPACAQCHAFSGSSDSSGAFPRLAGQPAAYLSRQMREYGSDVRASAVMSPIASALSPEDIADVAAYYAGVATPFPPLAAQDPDLVKKGERLVKTGKAREVPACALCHGTDGAARMPNIPYLAGQYASYTALVLREWQRGLRKDSRELMAPFAKRLDDQEIAAVAAYYQEARPAGVAASPPKR